MYPMKYTIKAQNTFETNVQQWKSSDRALRHWMNVLRNGDGFGVRHFYLNWQIIRDSDGVVIAESK